MSRARQVEWPTGPAKLTDIVVRSRFPARPAGHKSGDLTSDAVETIEETVALSANKPAGRVQVPVVIPVPIAPQQSEISSLEQSPISLGRSDVFNFSGLGADDLKIVSPTAADSELALPRSSAPVLFHLAEGADENSSGPSSAEMIPPSSRVAAAVTVDPGSSATDWCLVEQSHPCSPSPVLEAEVLPTRATAASYLFPINESREHSNELHVTDRASLPQIITMTTGALLIIAGVALVAAPVWHALTMASASREVVRLEDLNAKLSIGGDWFGLALILVGAALEVIGLRTRRTRYGM